MPKNRTGDPAMTLRCDMTQNCPKPVAYIDDKGFAYCTDHGQQRQRHCSCRKLRPHELRKLQRGEQLSRY